MSKHDEIDKALNSPDEEIRLQACRELAALDPEQSLDLVFQCFGDESWRVRKEAIDFFLRMPVSRELVGEIIELLHAEENAGLRNAAVEILIRMGRDAVPMLIGQARCPDHDVRKFIIDVLGDIADRQAIPTLIEGLSDDDSNVRASAAENLGKLRAVESVPALLKAMQYPDLLLQFTILDALGRIGAPVDFTALQPYKDEKLLRKALMDCLGKVGDVSALDELVKSLADPMRNVREAALVALAHLGQTVPADVRKLLKASAAKVPVMAIAGYLDEDGNHDLQRAAIRVLGWMGATDAIIKLLGMLDNERLQQESLTALTEICTAAPQSLVMAWAEVDNAHRAYLAYIFGEAGCRAGHDLLRQSLSSEDQQLQRMAAYALGKLGLPDDLPDLVKCLGQDDIDVQEAATQALICLGERFAAETLGALQPLLASEDAVLRKFAVQIIGRLPGDAVLNVLSMALKDPHAEVRRVAVKSFEGRDTTDYLSNILLTLTDEDAEVRRTAVEILSGSQDEVALDGLQLALQDDDIWVRSSAVRGLGRVGGEAALSLVAKAGADPIGLVSIAALETLVDMIGDQATPQLITALDHVDEEVVTTALNLLSRCGAGDWLTAHLEGLLNHPFWAVRSHFARFIAQALGAAARTPLEGRLAVETEDLVRQQLLELLDELPVD